MFDLNDRGMFKHCPSVTRKWGMRIIANDDMQLKIQYVVLTKERTVDPDTGKEYEWVAKESLMVLDEDLKLDAAALSAYVTDEGIRQDVMALHNNWRSAYITTKDDCIDRVELKKKLAKVALESKKAIQEFLVRKNEFWVQREMPRLIHDFQNGLYLHVKDDLYRKYQEKGGEDSESGLVKKIMLFYRVLENASRGDLMKPDGNKWADENEIYDCWIGFVGSEAESKRVCETIETVFFPLAV